MKMFCCKDMLRDNLQQQVKIRLYHAPSRESKAYTTYPEEIPLKGRSYFTACLLERSCRITAVSDEHVSPLSYLNDIFVMWFITCGVD